MEWYPDHMDFYFDGQPYHHVDLSQADQDGENAFRKPHCLLIDLALDPNEKIDDAALPQQLMVDYIRVYQLKDQAEGPGDRDPR
jgi:beta-glucanase (GH16 family)